LSKAIARIVLKDQSPTCRFLNTVDITNKFLNHFFGVESALVEALESAVQDARDDRFVPPDVAHERIRTMYTWENVARRTEKVSEFTNKSDWFLCAVRPRQTPETGHNRNLFCDMAVTGTRKFKLRNNQSETSAVAS